MNMVDSFRIDVPLSWRNVPLDRASLMDLLRENRESDAWKALSTVEQRRLDLYLQRFVSDIQSAGAEYAAIYAEVVEAEQGEVESTDAPPLIACCVVSMVDRLAIGSDLPLSVDVIQAAMSMTRDEPDASGTRTTNLEVPAIVDLPSGRAVRLPRLIEQNLSSKEVASFFTDTYFVPVPDEYDRTVVAQFSTPHLADSATFAELFEAIISTLQFYREGEETVL